MQNQDSFEQVFSFAGHAALYEQLGSKLWMYRHWDEQDMHTLELFLEVYWFDEEQELLTDDFLYHFRIFKSMSHNQELFLEND